MARQGYQLKKQERTRSNQDGEQLTSKRTCQHAHNYCIEKCKINIETRTKQCEIENWMMNNQCDVSAVNETGLKGNEYLGLNKGFNWFSVNRTWEKGSSGGAGFIVKNNVKLLKDVQMYDVVKNIKVGRESTNMKWC